MWRLGRGLARSWALTAVSAGLAPWLGHPDNPLRPRLREFCDEARAKRGTTRQAVVVASCFAPLWAWVLRLGDGTHVALALAATPWGTGCTLLVISVVYRGCALPLAGTVLTATVEQAWRPAWLRRLRQVYRAVPPPGRSSCSPSAAGMPAGSVGGFPGWGGSRCCRSRPAGPAAPPVSGQGLRSRPWSRNRVARGPVPAWPSKAVNAGSAVPAGPRGRPALRPLGGAYPLDRPPSVTALGRAGVPGVPRALNGPNGAAGRGTTPA